MGFKKPIYRCVRRLGLELQVPGKSRGPLCDRPFTRAAFSGARFTTCWRDRPAATRRRSADATTPSTTTPFHHTLTMTEPPRRHRVIFAPTRHRRVIFAPTRHRRAVISRECGRASGESAEFQGAKKGRVALTAENVIKITPRRRRRLPEQKEGRLAGVERISSEGKSFDPTTCGSTVLVGRRDVWAHREVLSLYGELPLRQSTNCRVMAFVLHGFSGLKNVVLAIA